MYNFLFNQSEIDYIHTIALLWHTNYHMIFTSELNESFFKHFSSKVQTVFFFQYRNQTRSIIVALQKKTRARVNDKNIHTTTLILYSISRQYIVVFFLLYSADSAWSSRQLMWHTSLFFSSLFQTLFLFDANQADERRDNNQESNSLISVCNAFYFEHFFFFVASSIVLKFGRDHEF